MGLTLLAHAHMPLKFWVEAFQTVVQTINLLPFSPLKFTTSFELLYHKQPNYVMLQPFGCACFPYLRLYIKYKFDFHSTKCVFLGYSHVQVGYKCLHSSGWVYVSRRVRFNPDSFPFPNLFFFFSVNFWWFFHSILPVSSFLYFLSSSTALKFLLINYCFPCFFFFTY